MPVHQHAVQLKVKLKISFIGHINQINQIDYQQFFAEKGPTIKTERFSYYKLLKLKY